MSGCDEGDGVAVPNGVGDGFGEMPGLGDALGDAVMPGLGGSVGVTNGFGVLPGGTDGNEVGLGVIGGTGERLGAGLVVCAERVRARPKKIAANVFMFMPWLVSSTLPFPFSGSR